MWAGRWVNFTIWKLRHCDLFQERINSCGQVTREINFCTVVRNSMELASWHPAGPYDIDGANRLLENLCSPGRIGCLKPLIMEIEAYTRERCFLAVKEIFSLSRGRERVKRCGRAKYSHE
jgi:hypothetical protein